MIGLFIQLLNTLQALGPKDLTKRLPSPVLCQPGSGMNKIFSFLTRTLCQRTSDYLVARCRGALRVGHQRLGIRNP